MIEQLANRFFHLRNERISYILHVMDNGQLEQLYYGHTLGKLTEAELDYLVRRENKSAGTVKFFDNGSDFTLTDHYQAYPVYGSTDFKEGALELKNQGNPLYTDFRFDSSKVVTNKTRNLAVPATYGEDAHTLQLTMMDQPRQLKLILNYTIFAGSPAIVQNQELINQGEETITIEKMLSGILHLPDAAYEFTHLSGAWLKERHEKRRKLEQGTVSIGSLKGASSHQHNPFVAFIHEQATRDTGDVYAMNFVYSGNFLAQAEVDEWANTRAMLGIHPTHFSWNLAKNEHFVTPEAVVMYSNQGTNGLSSAMSGFLEDHLIDQKWKNTIRPIVFNNWEATYFDFNEETLLELATEGKNLGMECFVIDDGWFGKRNSDRSSLGDWSVDERKFPSGIDAFAKKIHQMELQLGIWFEPEMISPDSQLYKEHPEWVVKHPYERFSMGRGQYVLDFANPTVVDSIYQQMKAIIQATNLDYIKWDMNRNITEAYSTYLAAEQRNQGEFFHRYILGVYALYEKILTDFPNILIEGCAGGGGRYDLGILFYSPQIWPSDDSDAVERLSIQSGTLLGYPLSSFSNHVSASPNHQVLRDTSLKFRQEVAIFGPLGYELDLNQLTEDEKEQIKTTVQFYKQHRQLLTFGKFVQFVPTYPVQNTVCWGVMNDEKTEAIIGCYQKLAQANPSAQEFQKIEYLNPDLLYQVGEDQLSGRLLENIGLRKAYAFNGANQATYQVGGDFQSTIYHIKAIEGEEG
ncbi:MAG: alpha-galactosidase [Enterococcus sp.]